MSCGADARPNFDPRFHAATWTTLCEVLSPNAFGRFDLSQTRDLGSPMNSRDPVIPQWERVFCVIGLLLMLRGLVPLYSSMASLQGAVRLQDRDLIAGNLQYQIISGIIYLIALVLLFGHRRAVIESFVHNKLLLAFLGLALASFVWAEFPLVTLRRALALCGTTIFATYLAVRFSPTELFRLTAISMMIVVYQTILVAVLFPSVGVDSQVHEGAWRGVLGHKNTTGRIMVLASLTLWVSARQGVLSPHLAWSALGGAVFVVIMSQSVTSYVVLACITLCLLILQILRRSMVPMFVRVLAIGSLFLMPLALLVVNYYQVGLEALGREATLTGRTLIWERAVEVGMENAWFGVGYRSFWTEQDLGPGLSYGHGHNSYLDIWLELGYVGVGLFLVTGIAAARRAFWRLTHTSNPFGSFYILFLISMVLFGLTSQVFPHRGTIEWTLYVVLLIHLTPLPTAAASRRESSVDLAPVKA